ncbi:hypothetical protein WDD9_001272 [Paenibacillus melissococcoides]|nr:MULTISPECIES: hypothetical protein [Paenibacillus]MEB9893345.1 hypothetical protein [Bacillus cereus]CAH8703839.1 hypothetical protein HTL2_000310 [Paenibacillus melissococcoides]CAH8706416.1 hypothetical protein WDD9_001272 [Paenibacillus melissococcoides]
MKQDEIDALASYVERGGSIVVAMKGWVMEQYPNVFLGEAYQGRTAKLNEDYPLQRLVNRMGLGLMNNIATTKTETFPKLTEEGVNHYHAAALVDQAKRVEAGELDPSQLQIGPAGAESAARTADSSISFRRSRRQAYGRTSRLRAESRLLIMCSARRRMKSGDRPSASARRRGPSCKAAESS